MRRDARPTPDRRACVFATASNPRARDFNTGTAETKRRLSRFWVAGAGLGASRRLGADRDACVAAPAAEPAPSQLQTLLISKQKRAPLRGTLLYLVAGAGWPSLLTPLSLSRRLYSDATHRAASACTRFLAGSNRPRYTNEKGPHKGGLSSFGSGGVICAVPTLAQRIRLK